VLSQPEAEILVHGILAIFCVDLEALHKGSRWMPKISMHPTLLHVTEQTEQENEAVSFAFVDHST